MYIGNFVDFRIFYSLMLLLIIPVGTVFAQESIITVQTDDNNYDEGDTIVISGKISTIVGSTPVTLQLFTEGNLVDIAQITVAQDGSYSHTIIAEGPLWKQENYIIKVSYGEGNIAESEFNFTPKSNSIKTTNNFEVDAGSHGTFDVEYTIKGGTIKDMTVDSSIFGIVVQIDTTDEGIMTLDLPKEFIGAEKQDGKEDTFIILIDGVEVGYQETINSKSRIITINFEQGDSKIEIIGTYVVPEFNTAIIILVVGIMTIMLVAKSRFQIKI